MSGYSGDSHEAWDASTGKQTRPPRHPWVLLIVVFLASGGVTILSGTAGAVVLAIGLIVCAVYAHWLAWFHRDKP